MTTTDGQFKTSTRGTTKAVPDHQTVIQHCLIQFIICYTLIVQCSNGDHQITCSWYNTEEGYTHSYHQSESYCTCMHYWTFLMHEIYLVNYLQLEIFDSQFLKKTFNFRKLISFISVFSSRVIPYLKVI